MTITYRDTLPHEQLGDLISAMTHDQQRLALHYLGGHSPAATCEALALVFEIDAEVARINARSAG